MDEAERAELESQIRLCTEAGDYERAGELAIAGYGPELMRFVAVLVRDTNHVDDVFAEACHDIWCGLPNMAWRSSFRTWAFALTRHACFRHLRSPARRRKHVHGTLSTQRVAQIVANVRTATQRHLKTESKHSLARLRESLSSEEQTLLTLRIDRALEWTEIAEVLDDPPPQGAALTARAAALRKRFERLTDKLRELALRQGLIDRG